MLRKCSSVSVLLSVFNRYGYSRFIRSIFRALEIIISFFSSSILIWSVLLMNSLIVTQPCITCTNLTSYCMSPSQYGIGFLTNILLTTLSFISDTLKPLLILFVLSLSSLAICFINVT